MPLDDQQNPDLPVDASGLPEPVLPDDVHGGDEAPLLPAGPEVSAPSRHRDWDKVRHTRTGRAWVGLIVGAIVLVLLLVFILQNLESTRVNLLFWEFNTPVGIAVLFAAIIGALLAGLIGGARILQLRRAAKKP